MTTKRGARLLRAAVALLAFAFLVALASAATRLYSSGSLRVPIPERGTIEETITVPESGPVARVAVWLRLDHARVSDLTIAIVAPDGTTVPLSVRRGRPGGAFGSGSRDCRGEFAVFDDDADLRLAAERPPYEGAFRPDGRLALLHGKEARGRWTLRVRDDEGGARGMLYCWKLDLSRDVVEVKVARSGKVRAQLSFRELNFTYRDVRLKVSRGGRTLYDRPLRRLGCVNCPYWRPAVEGRRPIVVRDLDSDREPEVVLDVFTGGAHCCTYSLILKYSAEKRTYRSRVVYWGNVGYRLVDLDRDGRPELSSGDDRFAYRFAPYAASVPPVRIWRYERGRLHDVTRRFPGVVRAHAARLWGLYERTRRSEFPEVRGILAAYMAEQYLLGRETVGWGRLELAFRRGDLGRRATRHGYPAGRAYLQTLRRFLRATGYAR